MLKTIFPLIAVILIGSCYKSAQMNVYSGVAGFENNDNEIKPSNRYNRQQLQKVLDSLMALDSRNTIHHQLDIYGTGKNWYTVNIHKVYNGDDNLNSGENGNLRFHTGSMKIWLLAHSIKLASVITACTYDIDTFVGIHYLGEDGRVYFSSIINLSWPDHYICSGSIAHGWLPGIRWQ
jgi:hypothetical protein